MQKIILINNHALPLGGECCGELYRQCWAGQAAILPQDSRPALLHGWTWGGVGHERLLGWERLWCSSSENEWMGSGREMRGGERRRQGGWEVRARLWRGSQVLWDEWGSAQDQSLWEAWLCCVLTWRLWLCTRFCMDGSLPGRNWVPTGVQAGALRTGAAPTSHVSLLGKRRGRRLQAEKASLPPGTAEAWGCERVTPSGEGCPRDQYPQADATLPTLPRSRCATWPWTDRLPGGSQAVRNSVRCDIIYWQKRKEKQQGERIILYLIFILSKINLNRHLFNAWNVLNNSWVMYLIL